MNTLSEVSPEDIIGSAKSFSIDTDGKYTGTYVATWIDTGNGSNTLVTARLVEVEPSDLTEAYQSYRDQVGSGIKNFIIGDWHNWTWETWVHIWNILHAFALESVRTDNPKIYIDWLRFATHMICQCMDSESIDREVKKIMKSCRKMEWGRWDSDDIDFSFFRQQLQLRAEVRRNELIRIHIDQQTRRRVDAIRQRSA